MVPHVGSADPRPKVDVRTWKDLREQLKGDIAHAYKQCARLTTLNQLLLLRNFATLWMKGSGRMAASQEIAWQWHDGEGAHFARQVRVLAHHYQIHEQLPDRNWGGYRGCSIFNDERLQSATVDWLSKLPTGEVSLIQFARHLPRRFSLPWASGKTLYLSGLHNNGLSSLAGGELRASTWTVMSETMLSNIVTKNSYR